ncbi:MAG: CPBP family intramembrane metalloprotease [Flavobacteriales bacterium]|nr:CPBP family intramembrane metalloprotease [Flavobacteriales bacterium]
MKVLISFFGLAYLFSWIIWLPLYLPAFGLRDLPVFPFHHALGGLGPLLAAFACIGIFEGKKGMYQLLKQCFYSGPSIYVLIALFSPFILAISAEGINYLISGNPFDPAALLHSREFPEFNLLNIFIYNLIFFGFGEEVGWRGFALPRLQSKFNALNSGLILTVFWAVWHWPLFLYRPGYTNMEFAEIFGWIFSLLTGSVLLSWLYNSSGYSILICAIFHSTIDIAFTADFSGQQQMNYMGFLITLWGILTIVIFKPKNLSNKERLKINSEYSK